MDPIISPRFSTVLAVRDQEGHPSGTRIMPSRHYSRDDSPIVPVESCTLIDHTINRSFHGSMDRSRSVCFCHSSSILTVDLEFLFRSHCRTLRVVQHLAGDAHLLITKLVGSTSLAVRVYHHHQYHPPSDYRDDHGITSHDSLQTFYDSYQMAVVFIVASTSSTVSGSDPCDDESNPSSMMSLLNDPSSLFHTAQRLACHATLQQTSKVINAMPRKRSSRRSCNVVLHHGILFSPFHSLRHLGPEKAQTGSRVSCPFCRCRPGDTSDH